MDSNRFRAEHPGTVPKPHCRSRLSKLLPLMPWPGGCLPCQGAPSTAPGLEPRLLCRLLHLQTAPVALRGGSGPTFMLDSLT